MKRDKIKTAGLLGIYKHTHLAIGMLSALFAGCADFMPNSPPDLPLSWGAKKDLAAVIESQVVMPEGARAIAKYVRYYSFVRKNGEDVAYALYIYSETQGRVVMVDWQNQPAMSDGGCDIVAIWYSISKNKVTSVECNGTA